MGASMPPTDSKNTLPNSQSVVLKVSRSVSLALENLHFVVKTFGAGVVAGKAPRGGDHVSPGAYGRAPGARAPNNGSSLHGVGRRLASLQHLACLQPFSSSRSESRRLWWWRRINESTPRFLVPLESRSFQQARK